MPVTRLLALTLVSSTHPFSLVSLQRPVHELHRHLLILCQPGQDKLEKPPGTKHGMNPDLEAETRENRLFVVDCGLLLWK